MRFAIVALLMGCAASFPKAIEAPAGGHVVMRALGRGKQIYVCQRAEEEPFRWSLREPVAMLFDGSGRIMGQHYVGPTWEAIDGSRVVGAKREAADSPDGSIPWLLLSAQSTAGDGVFAGVSWIQRVDTQGGQAPESACDAQHLGAVRVVPYSATYVFYATAAR